MPGHRRFSVVSPAATFGAAVRRTVRLPCAVSAIPISSALTARAVAASGHRLSWFVRCNRFCRLMLPRPLVVCTGGEPLLQLDAPLLEAMHHAGFRVAIETNGTQLALPGIDWICVSPKAGAPLVLDRGNELKLVFPQLGAEPPAFERLAFDHFFLQPMDAPARTKNTHLAVTYCLAHPR